MRVYEGVSSDKVYLFFFFNVRERKKLITNTLDKSFSPHKHTKLQKMYAHFFLYFTRKINHGKFHFAHSHGLLYHNF